MEKDAILNVRDMADLLKTGQKTARATVQEGVLPAFRVGGQLRFRRTDIAAWIAKQVTAAAEEPRKAAPRTIEDARNETLGLGDDPDER